MVPMLASTSSGLMPMPLSETVSVLASLSAVILIFHSGSFSRMLSSFRDSNRARSIASEAFEMISRRKISLLEYREWITRSSSFWTSVLN